MTAHRNEYPWEEHVCYEPSAETFTQPAKPWGRIFLILCGVAVACGALLAASYL